MKGGSHSADLKAFYAAVVTRTVLVLEEDWHRDQGNRTENSDSNTDPHKYAS